jgi:hypothetical protein
VKIQSMHFKARVGEKLADRILQENLAKAKPKFVDSRAKVMPNSTISRRPATLPSSGATAR